MQQFLADSPWDPELLVRACAERVAPEIGVLAWVVDDTGIAKDGKHSPGVKRQYSGTLGKIGNCQITCQRARRRRSGARCRWAGALYLPEEWCGDDRRGGEGEDPGRGPLSRRSRELAAGALRAGGGLGDPDRADPRRPRLRRRHTLPHPACTSRELEYCSRSVRAETSVYGPETTFAVPERNGSVGRRAVGRPARPQTGVGARARPAAAGEGVEDAALPHHARRARTSRSRFAFVRVVATHPVRNHISRRARSG